MVDFVPILLLVFGLVSVVVPDRIATIHRHQKATGTRLQMEDVEVSETWIGVTRITGVVFVLLGLGLTVQSL